MRRPLFLHTVICTRSQTVKDLSPGCDFVGVAQRAGEVDLSVSCADSSPNRRAGPPSGTAPTHESQPAACELRAPCEAAASCFTLS